MFSVICAWTNVGANHRDAGDLRRHRAHYNVTVIKKNASKIVVCRLPATLFIPTWVGITNWGFEWDRISKLQKRALRIMKNSRYNAHTEPLFKQLHLLKVKDIFEIQCLKFWYKYVNNKLPHYFRSMFTYNHQLHEIETRNHDRLHLYPTRTSGARNVLRHHIPELLNKFPPHLVERFKTHSSYSVSHHIKCYLIDLYSYDCDEIDCYICNNNWERKIGDSVTWVLWQPFDHWLWPGWSQ